MDIASLLQPKKKPNRPFKVGDMSLESGVSSDLFHRTPHPLSPPSDATMPDKDVIQMPDSDSALAGLLQRPRIVKGQPINPDMDEVDSKMKAYSEIGSQPAKKQNPWAQAAFLALQGIKKYTDLDAGREGDDIELLGNAKKRYQMEQMQNELRPLLEAKKYQQEQEKIVRDAQGDNLNMDRIRSLIDTTQRDDARMDADLERKVKADESKVEYWKRKADQGDLKLANDQELLELRDKWATSKNENDQKRLQLVEKEMENRMKRSEMSQSGQDRRSQARIEAQKALTEYREAEKKNNIQAMNESRERLVRLKAELGEQ